jgi:glycosyltransferase involved in cell wall biosynthesis
MHILPAASIIIPTYNRCELLLETLCSVKKQTFENWECIIIDDGSTDDTVVQVANFIFDDIRFQFVKRPQDYPKGACSCRNYGFDLSKGKYIQWLDDDDLLSANKLELQIKKLEEFKDSKIFTTCDWDFFWTNKPYLKKNLFHSTSLINPSVFFSELTKQQTFLPVHSYLVHRELVLRAGPWNVRLSLNDDAEFFTRVLLNSDNLINTEGCFVLYREHRFTRISRDDSAKGIKSFLLSLQLMQVYLKHEQIIYKPYFKRKLFNIFYNYWELHPRIIKSHYFFFKENGIDLRMAYFYLVKYSIYKKVYPWYKSNFKKNN